MIGDLPIKIGYELKGFDEVLKSFKKMNEQFDKIEKSIKHINTSMVAFGKNSKAAFSGQKELDKLTSKIGKLTAKINKLNNTPVNVKVNNGYRGVGSPWISGGFKTNFGGVGIGGSANMLGGLVGGGAVAGLAVGAVAAAVVAGLKDGFDRMREFDYRSTKLAAAGGLNSAEDNRLRNTNIELSKNANVGLTPTQIAELQYKAVTAGFSGIETLKKITPVIGSFAKGNDLQGEEATNILTSSLFTFFKGNEEKMSRVADVITKASLTTRTDPRELAMALRNVGSVAANNNVSFEKTNALLMALAQSGRVGGSAGTHTKIMMQRMYSPNAMSKEGLASIGVNAFDSKGGKKDFTALLGEIKNNLSGLSDASKMSTLRKLFGAEAAASAQTILNNLDQISAYTTELEHSSGTTAEMSKKMANTLNAHLDRVDSAWERFVLSIDNGSSGIGIAIKGVLTGIEKMLDAVRSVNIGELIGIATFTIIGALAGGPVGAALGAALGVGVVAGTRYVTNMVSGGTSQTQTEKDKKVRETNKLLATNPKSVTANQADLLRETVGEYTSYIAKRTEEIYGKNKNKTFDEVDKIIANDKQLNLAKRREAQIKLLLPETQGDAMAKKAKMASDLASQEAESRRQLQDQMQKEKDVRRLLIDGMSDGYEKQKKLYDLETELKVEEFQKAGMKPFQYAGYENDRILNYIKIENESINADIERKLTKLEQNKYFDPYAVRVEKPENNVKAVTFEIGNVLNVEELKDGTITKEQLSKMMLEALNTVIGNIGLTAIRNV